METSCGFLKANGVNVEDSLRRPNGTCQFAPNLKIYYSGFKRDYSQLCMHCVCVSVEIVAFLQALLADFESMNASTISQLIFSSVSFAEKEQNRFYIAFQSEVLSGECQLLKVCLLCCVSSCLFVYTES